MPSRSFRLSCAYASLLWLLVPACLAAQAAVVTGRVTSENGTAIASVVIEAFAAGGGAPEAAAAARVVSDGQGRYTLRLAPGAYRVHFAAFGYAAHESTVQLRADTAIDVTLTVSALELNPVVVSASRRTEKALDAPATVYTVTERAVQERAAITLVDHLHGMAGLDVTTTGIATRNFVARGFTNVFSSGTLLLVDNRFGFSPALRSNTAFVLPVTDDDIERIEVVLGPAAALYGPNAASGVVHVLTKSPFDSEGTTVGVMTGARAGNRAVRRFDLSPATEPGATYAASLRHAQLLGSRAAFKVSAQYARAGEWPEYDAVEDSARAAALARNADPDTLRVGRRVFEAERWSADARIDLRLRDSLDVIVAGGLNHTVSAIHMTTLGSAQQLGSVASYAQVRARWGRLFGQALLNATHAGDSYLLRTGSPSTDDSRFVATQLQHSAAVGARERLVYGVDAQFTTPRTSRAINGRNEDADGLREVGGYVHSETRLSERLSLIGAVRLDWHNRLEEPVWSPRAALVLRPRDGHSVRLTYNRAFETPSNNNLFLDLIAARLGPYNLRALGVPAGGLRFARSCTGIGGLCARSPFAIGSIPALATPLWNAAVAAFASGGGPNLSGIPAPGPSDVATVLRRLDPGRGAFFDVAAADVRDVDELRPQITQAVELGYKGIIGGRVLLSADVYWTRKADLIGSLSVVTPNVFFDAASLATYLTRFMNATQAQAIAAAMGGVSGSTSARGIPLATVAPEHHLAQAPDLLLSFQNHGTVSYWGSDLSVTAQLGRRTTVSLAHAHVSKDLFPEVAVGPDTLARNAPGERIAAAARYQTDAWSSQLRLRWADSFVMNSGVYHGELPAYGLVDIDASWRLPWDRRALLSLSVQNALDNQHREFLGAPVLGRVVLSRLQYSF